MGWYYQCKKCLLESKVGHVCAFTNPLHENKSQHNEKENKGEKNNEPANTSIDLANEVE